MELEVVNMIKFFPKNFIIVILGHQKNIMLFEDYASKKISFAYYVQLVKNTSNLITVILDR